MVLSSKNSPTPVAVCDCLLLPKNILLYFQYCFPMVIRPVSFALEVVPAGGFVIAALMPSYGKKNVLPK